MCFFFEREKESVFQWKASLEYSKIQNLICNNSITHRIMPDTLTLYICKYNNKHHRSQDYGQSVYVALYSRFTWQCNCFLCITYYVKKCHSWQRWQVWAFSKDLALTIYTLLGGLGIKNDVKNSTKIWEHMFFMQTSDCVINYLNKNKIFVALSTICGTFFFTLPSKNAVFICLGEISFLGYKVGKLIFFFLRVVFEFYTL